MPTDLSTYLLWILFSVIYTFVTVVPEIRRLYYSAAREGRVRLARFYLTLWYTSPLWSLVFLPLSVVLIVISAPFILFFSIAYGLKKAHEGFKKRWDLTDV